jgi:hypothetical protein
MNHFQLLRDELSIVMHFLDAQTAIAMLSIDRNTRTRIAAHRHAWTNLLQRRYGIITLTSQLACIQFQGMWLLEQQTYTLKLKQIELSRQLLHTEYEAACAQVLRALLADITYILSRLFSCAMLCLWLLGYIRVAQCFLFFNYLCSLSLLHGSHPTHISEWMHAVRETCLALLYSGEVLASYRVILLSILYIFPIVSSTWSAVNNYGLKQFMTVVHCVSILSIFSIVRSTWSAVNIYGLKQLMTTVHCVATCHVFALFVVLTADGWNCANMVKISACIPVWVLFILVNESYKNYGHRFKLMHLYVIVIVCSVVVFTVFASSQTLKMALAFSAACFFFGDGVCKLRLLIKTPLLWPAQTRIFFPINPRIPADKRCSLFTFELKSAVFRQPENKEQI